ncbi:NUDIX hydrolase [Fodinibius halophilus]|uniref:CoA pyrophosphatase n=1 Tax=Fodinibius halophilus TaxID=1736908 RepID=A0A6M1TAR9_9BACT|nr:CoA pyrophosphatase [Fodinibius halophilus]NGP89523.1 CoA pyrophosphatase [Fodinibius halophilus]
MKEFTRFLKNRLQKELPGRKAQLKMAPRPVSSGSLRKMEPPDHANDSSVLILLFPNEENKPELTLTLRSRDIDHGGQISFPGGRAEQGESAAETALREAEEEIGIPPESITIIGQLSDLYINNSNNLVTPVVGVVKKKPNFKINPSEVEEVFAVELNSLLHKKNLTVENWELGKHRYKVPYWDIHQVPLWGATAMMLHEFLDIYQDYCKQ